jgi:hypothetical protein
MGIFNMKNILPLIIVGTLVLSGLGAVALPKTLEPQTLNNSIFVSEPIIKQTRDYITVSLPEQSSFLLDTGKPVIPVLVWSTTFAPNTKINNVQVNYKVKEYKLAAKIEPSPQKIPLSPELAAAVSQNVLPDSTVYTSTQLYPIQPYTIQKGVGLDNENNHVLYLNVRITPQYSPSNDILFAPDGEIKITVDYTPPEKPLFTANAANMLIITSEKYVSKFQPLIDHKNANGIQTIIDTVENIYSTYTSGRNEPEKIKLRIKDAIEQDGITYVLLGGGRQGQSMKWIIPEFRNNNDDGWESGYAADLYYSDIYKIVGSDTVFEDWDSNTNGVFGEFKGFTKDVMDFYPDVHIGRIAFHYGFELDNAVQKIITYETTSSAEWFQKTICIAGDTFPSTNAYYEGEIETGVTANNFQAIGFDVEKLWTSLGTLTGEPDVITAISGGAGFVHFAGHGNPSTWSTHPPENESWINGMSLKHIMKLKNNDKLPFVLVGGCHNAQFNTSMGEILVGIKHYGLLSYFGYGTDPSFRFFYMEWVPRDWASWFLLKKSGGSIGTIGMASLGYGYIDQYAADGLGGWIETRFFNAYTNQSLTKAGDCHGRAISDYITIIGNVNSDQIDRKTIEAFTLIGDPSVEFGGYVS